MKGNLLIQAKIKRTLQEFGLALQRLAIEAEYLKAIMPLVVASTHCVDFEYHKQTDKWKITASWN